MNSESRLTMDDKENVSTNRILKTAKGIFGNKVQTPSQGQLKLNTKLGTPTNKEMLENKFDKVPTNSPPDFATPRANVVVDKNSKNKLSMLHFGKAKFSNNKHQRNSCLKPPKQNYTINSNRNSGSDCSFQSNGNIGIKPAFHDQYTPSHLIRGSFDIRSSEDFLNNTVQGVLKKQDSTCENFNPMFNATLDARDPHMGDL